MVLPNFLIVGSAKAGTTSLNTMLGQHPQVFMSARKETHHFMHVGRPSAWSGPGDEEMNGFCVADPAEYEDMFAAGAGLPAVGEASVFYMTSPSALEEARARLGDIRVVATLRDPSRRAFSAYSHLAMRAREDLDFTGGLAAESERLAAGWEPLWGYHATGCYASQVESLFDVFGQQHVLLLRFEELMGRPEEQLRTVFEFVGVDPEVPVNAGARLNDTGRPRSRAVQKVLSGGDTRVRSVVRKAVPAGLRHRGWTALRRINLERTAADPAVLAQLRSAFAPDVRRVEALTGWDLSSWR